MSTASLAKSGTEYWQWSIAEYQKNHPGSFVLEPYLEWALSVGHIRYAQA